MFMLMKLLYCRAHITMGMGVHLLHAANIIDNENLTKIVHKYKVRIQSHKNPSDH